MWSNKKYYKSIVVGAPSLPNSSVILGPTTVGFNEIQNYSYNGTATNTSGTTTYQWSFDAPINDDGGPTCAWVLMSGQGTKNITVRTGCIPTLAVVRVVAVTSCGTSNMKYTYVYTGISPKNSSTNFNNLTDENETIYSTYSNNSLTEEGNIKLDNESIISAKLFDISGNLIKEFRTNEYDVSGIEKGIYILKVETREEIITTKISL